MKIIYSLVALATLAACGADGMPEAPASKAGAPMGLSVSGCATAGIVKGTPVVGGPARC
jgi:hypothetical protein